MPISDLCTERAVTVGEDASLQAVANLMKDHHIGSVVVTGDDGAGRPVGIITDRDIVIRGIADKLNLERTKARELMSSDLVTVEREQGLYETLRVMKQRGVRRVLVVDRQGALCGIASADDLVQMLGEEMSAIGELFQMQAVREEKERPLPTHRSLM